jgi:hypothetical protein
MVGALAVAACAFLAAVYLTAAARRFGDRGLERYFSRRAAGAGAVTGALAIGGLLVLRRPPSGRHRPGSCGAWCRTTRSSQPDSAGTSPASRYSCRPPFRSSRRPSRGPSCPRVGPWSAAAWTPSNPRGRCGPAQRRGSVCSYSLPFARDGGPPSRQRCPANRRAKRPFLAGGGARERRWARPANSTRPTFRTAPSAGSCTGMPPTSLTSGVGRVARLGSDTRPAGADGGAGTAALSRLAARSGEARARRRPTEYAGPMETASDGFRPASAGPPGSGWDVARAPGLRPAAGP